MSPEIIKIIENLTKKYIPGCAIPATILWCYFNRMRLGIASSDQSMFNLLIKFSFVMYLVVVICIWIRKSNLFKSFREGVREIVNSIMVKRNKSSQEILDYLTDKEINPFVMCSPLGSKDRNLKKRKNKKSKFVERKCQRFYCRCVIDKELFNGENKGHRPGDTRLEIGIKLDEEKITWGTLHSWSAIDIAIITNSKSSTYGYKLFVFKIFKYKRLKEDLWYSWLKISEIDRSNDNIIIGEFNWDKFNPKYKSIAPIWPICPNKNNIDISDKINDYITKSYEYVKN